jgi:hypothetical protein
VLAYKKRNPERNCNWGHRRRARERSAILGTVDLKIVKASRKSCLYCGAQLSLHLRQVDHVVPIALGGLHTMFNLVVACGSCNARKRDKPIEEWLRLIPPSRQTFVACYILGQMLIARSILMAYEQQWRAARVESSQIPTLPPIGSFQPLRKAGESGAEISHIVGAPSGHL